MAVTMNTCGSGLAVRPGTSEADLVEFARQMLEHELDADDVGDKYGVDIAQIRSAERPEELFAAFALVVMRDAAGNLVGCFGVDDVDTAPLPKLFTALAPGLVDGSFFAFHVDYGCDRLLYVENGVAREKVYDEGTLAPWRWRAREQMTAVELEARLRGLDEVPSPVRVLTRPPIDTSAACQMCEDAKAYTTD